MIKIDFNRLIEKKFMWVDKKAKAGVLL